MSSPSIPPRPFGPGDLDPDPNAQFIRWFDAARSAGVHEPEAMALATADAQGAPSVRMVLLRGYGHDGYVWYTNYDSRKGRDLAANPRAALAIHWPSVGRQVRIEGRVARIGEAESDAYFALRDPGSQAGAWASRQSAPIPDRAALEAAAERTSAAHAGRPIPRPPYWGGYRLTPEAFEFWQHRDDRLHDRFAYLPAPSGGWHITRLAP